MEGIRIFINKLLESGNVKSSEIPPKNYVELLTEFEKLKYQDYILDTIVNKAVSKSTS
ncbi:MAG: hypothetical protein ACD_20C00129G0009 [uncultured bacterium]|nr:MAG: hypothetical protein ACD_20C00129G0009 [uncultured bacterium]